METCDVVTQRVSHQIYLCHHVEAVPIGIFSNAVVLQLGLGDKIRLVVIEAVEISTHAVVQRCEAGVFAIRSHVLRETAFLQDAVECTQIRSVAQQLSNGLLVRREKV